MHRSRVLDRSLSIHVHRPHPFHCYSSYDICGKICGLISWSLNKRSLSHSPYVNFGRNITSWLYKTLMVIIATVFLVTFIVIARSAPSREQGQTKFDDLVLKINLIIGAVSMLIIFIYHYAREGLFWKLLELLCKHDNLLLGRIKKRNVIIQHFLFNLLFISGKAFMWTIGVVHADELSICQKILVGSLNLLILLAQLFSVSFFSVVAYLCSECFFALNEKLHFILSSSTPFKQHIYAVRLSYECGYQLAEEIQNAFALPVTVYLTANAFSLGLAMYVLTLGGFSKIDIVLLSFITIVISTVILYNICSSSDSIAYQARLVRKCLNSVNGQNLSGWERFEVTMLVDKLNHCPIEITSVFGLFTVNKGTFMTIISTIITYLIILVQFRPEARSGNAALNATAIQNMTTLP